MTAYLILVALWVAYFSFHSWLASHQAKKALSFLGKWYRLFYSILATTGLFSIAIWMAVQPNHYFWQVNNISKSVGLILSTFSIFIFKQTFRQYKLKQFLGFQSEEKPVLVREGVLAHVRHPIYTATILLSTGYFIFSPNDLNLISVVCIFLYLVVGIRLEERKLVEEFGATYQKYKQEVPMLVPKNWREMLGGKR